MKVEMSEKQSILLSTSHQEMEPAQPSTFETAK